MSNIFLLIQQVGWMGYSDDKVGTLCNEYMNKGFTAFKVKVSLNFNIKKKNGFCITIFAGWSKFARGHQEMQIDT